MQVEVSVLTTTAITSITQTTAVSGGNITDDKGGSVIARGVCWGKTPNPTISDFKSEDGIGTGSFTSSITGLTAGTTYYVRAYSTNSAGTGYGNQVSFITNPIVTELTTTAISSITQTTAISGGNITSDNGGFITTKGVCWGTSPSPTIANYKTTDGTGTGVFISSLTGLLPNITYYVRAYAINSIGVGTDYGNEISFTTLNIGEQPGNTVEDVDGNLYKTVIIGNQEWMKENLKTTKYNDNTSIILTTNSTSWSNMTTPSYCWYNNDEANYKSTYGALYNWYAVNTGKLCPNGWHVPSDSEWYVLALYLDANATLTGNPLSTVAGGKMKEAGTAHWKSPNTGATNESGFTALPAGIRESDGHYQSVGDDTFWWSTNSSIYDGESWYYRIYYYFGYLRRGTYYNKIGMSVRCLKN